MTDPKISAALRAVVDSTDKPVALGWDVLRKARADAGAHLTDKEIFLAGAGFLFDILIYSMTSGEEPKPEDLILVSKLHDELAAFREHFDRKLQP